MGTWNQSILIIAKFFTIRLPLVLYTSWHDKTFHDHDDESHLFFSHDGKCCKASSSWLIITEFTCDLWIYQWPYRLFYGFGGMFHAEIHATYIFHYYCTMIGITSISFFNAARTLGQLLASLFIRLYLNHWFPHGVYNYRWGLYCACNIISVSRMMFLSHNGNHPSTGWRTSEFRTEERENPSAWRAPCTTSIIFGWSLESSESSNISSSSRSAWYA